MSRLALKPISIPSQVTVIQADRVIRVTGPKGSLEQIIPAGVIVKLEPNSLMVKRTQATLQARANHGLIARLIGNMITGVADGYTKKLELVGTGYRAKKEANRLVVSAGFSHPVYFNAPAGIELQVPQETVISVTGFDKQLVGQVAANIRSIRPPEPYKGKGIRYSGEVIRRKAGKATKTGAA